MSTTLSQHSRSTCSQIRLRRTADYGANKARGKRHRKKFVGTKWLFR